jgi:hypothetical protein
MFSMSRSTKHFPQLKMCVNCVKSYSSKNNKCSPRHCRPLLQKNLGRGSPFNVSYQNCCKNIYVNDSQNLPFATSHFVIELFPLIIRIIKSSESTKKCKWRGLHLLFFYRSYQVLLTDVVIIPSWAIQGPGSL